MSAVEPDPSYSSCGGTCSLCRGVPRIDPQTYVTPPDPVTLAMLLRDIGQPDVRSALLKLKSMLNAQGIH